jgi:hypothetical protein
MLNKLGPFHIGTQPIRVLQHNITWQFENTTPDFLSRTKKLIQTKGLNPGLQYHVNERSILDDKSSTFIQKKLQAIKKCTCT